MKVAFCLSGIAGGLNENKEGVPVDFKIGFDHYKKHILGKNNCDVFIHTWSVQFEKEIKKLYKPKKSIFQKQIIFDTPNFLDKMFRKRPYNRHATYSRWYSIKKVMELKRQYEKENKFKYDCVFLTRFDVAFFKDVIFKNYDMGKFYVAYGFRFVNPKGIELPNNLYWQTLKTTDMSKYKRKFIGHPYTNSGLSDLWFFSNSDYMDKFSTLYDHLEEYDKECEEFSNHLLALHHLKKLYILHKLDFALFRFDDFEVVRRKFFGYTR